MKDVDKSGKMSDAAVNAKVRASVDDLINKFENKKFSLWLYRSEVLCNYLYPILWHKWRKDVEVEVDLDVLVVKRMTLSGTSVKA